MRAPNQPHNRQLLEFLGLRQQASTAALFEDFPGSGDNYEAFCKRLSYLKGQGWLLVTGTGTRAIWQLNPEARPMHSAASRVIRRAAQSPAQVSEPSIRTPPSSLNRMQGDYPPPRPPVLRPGSDDHTHVPSLRQGQRVAFVPGYIPL